MNQISMVEFSIGRVRSAVSLRVPTGIQNYVWFEVWTPARLSVEIPVRDPIRGGTWTTASATW